MDDPVTSVERPTDRDRSPLPELIPTHLRATRRSWVFLLVAAIAVLALVGGGRALVVVRDAVVPGVFYDLRQRVVPPVSSVARAAGVHRGDLITALDGRAFADAFALGDYARTVGVDRTIHLDVATAGGDTRTVVLATFAPSWPNAWVRYLVGAAFLLVGIAVFWFHPGRRESWPFLFAFVAWGVTIVSSLGVPRSTQTVLELRLALFAYALIGPMFVHLFAVFPRPLRVVVRHPRLLLGLDLAAVALGILDAAAQGTTGPAAIVLVLVVATTAASAIASLAILAWRWRRPAPSEDTTRLRALIVAAMLAFPVPTGLSLAHLLGFTPTSELAGWVGPAMALWFPVIVGYAILRRDLFEIDRAVARTAAASAIVGAVALVAIGLAFAIPELVAPDSVVASPGAMAIVVLGGVATLWPLKRRVQQRLLDRFGDPRTDEYLGEAREALADLAKAAEPARFGRFERRLEEVVDVADAALLLSEDAGWRRPATGERVERGALPCIVELRLQDTLVGALGFGRPKMRFALSRRASRIVEGLAPEIARALQSRHSGESIGDYKIERFLAAGGMGNVYVAAKIGAGGFVKPVAIKQLLPEYAVDPVAVERFLKEARLVARLSHPGIVQTLELGETDRGYFIVMEYVDGVDAATLMRRLKRRRQRVPLPLAAHIVTSTCVALDHVHRARDEAGTPLVLIHHDVSPHNLMIDDDGNVKLADFGVAHVRHDPSLVGKLVGKVGYISPEQIAGVPYDHRIDVFAAGIVLYELITGQHPFWRGTEEATLRATEHGRYLPAETLREDCPDALVQVVARALAPVETRYATAAELADAIQRVYPLDSRHATELGRLVRSVRVIGPAASGAIVAPTLTLPTVRG